VTQTVNISRLAKVVRSKNAKAFKLTFDIIFNDREAYEKARASGILTKELIAKLYNVPLGNITTCLWFSQGNAFKATILRPRVSGSAGDPDVYGCQQHLPLLSIEIP